VECACALFPANLRLYQNTNISLRGLRNSARRRACALMGMHGTSLYLKYIDHIMKSEHECALLRLPRTMAVHGYLSLVGQILVGIGMCGSAQSCRNASCPFDINEISCLSHVWPTRQVNFRVFWPEKRIPAGKCIFPCVVHPVRQPVSCSVGSAGICVVGGLLIKPIVNNTMLACASIYCRCSCIQPLLPLFLYAAFKSYNMLSVHILCQSRS
jgi:hypothetical protein